MGTVKHDFVSTIPDGADADLVRPSSWNADHDVTLTAADISADSTTLVGTGVHVQAVLEELDNGVADHLADTSAAHAASAVSIADAANDFTATDVEGALAELQSDNEAHLVAADPHTGYIREDIFDAAGDLLTASADNTPLKLAKGNALQVLRVNAGATDLEYADPAGGLPLGLTGAVAATRYVGGHATGAPTTGDFLAGDFVITLTGKVYVCTAPGTPGTWVEITAAHAAAADPHTGYMLESLFDAAGDLLQGSADNTPAKLTKGTAGQFLQAGASVLAYADAFIHVPFSKQGVVTVTTESDSPAPFRWYNRSGRTLTFHSVSANATIGPSGSTMTIDTNVDGTTIMTGTKVVLPDNTGAASVIEQTTFSTTTVANGHYVSVNVDTAGGGAVQNLFVDVWLKG